MALPPSDSFSAAAGAEQPPVMSSMSSHSFSFSGAPQALVEVNEEWRAFFLRAGGKAKPNQFYQKCVTLLEMQDLYAPGDLADLNFEDFKQQLAKTDVTAGMKMFLEQAANQAAAELLQYEKVDSASQGPYGLSAPALAPAPMPARASASTPARVPAPALAPARELAADDEDEEVIEPGDAIAVVLAPGNEDTSELMRRNGGFEINWTGRDGSTRAVKKFREVPMKRVVSADLALPALYLHFLDHAFLLQDGESNPALRSSNDNSELQIVLPEDRIPDRAAIPEEWRSSFDQVRRFLKSQCEVMASPVEEKSAGFSPKKNYKTTLNTRRWYYSLRAARPKAAVNLDKPAFGIPGEAELYLFAENHASVGFMSRREMDAFELCIGEMPQQGGDIAKFGVFLKVFFEGGFAYNAKLAMGSGKGYLPKNVGIAGMSTVPAFENQSGIATGYPYIVPSKFLPFIDTVPVTIRGISEMSSRHARYGLCFTRSIFLWEGDTFAEEGVLNFCSIVPHGGFYYTPGTMRKHWKQGGLLYAFGEAKDSLEQAVSMDGIASASGGHPGASAAAASPQAPSDLRVCVICLEQEAVLAGVPCGHRAFCGPCGEAYARGKPCPICRALLTATLRVY